MARNKKARQNWQVALTYVGTVIGAGFASGQEILRFFGVFGLWGLVGALLAGLMFALLGQAIIEAAANQGANNYEQFIRYLFGKKAVWFDGIITLFLLAGLAALLVASGSLFAQVFGATLWKGFLFAALFIYIILLMGIEGMLWFNTLFVPGLIIVCLAVAVLGINEAGLSLIAVEQSAAMLKDSWLLGAFLYVAYNLVLGMVILVSLEDRTKRTCSNGGVIGGIILGFMAAIMCAALISQGQEVTGRSIPMLALAQKINPALGACYNLALWIAIFTTALSNGAGLLKRLESKVKWPRPMLAGLILLPTIIFVNWPLAKMVGIIYPLLGYVGLIIIIAVIIKLKPFVNT